jgi:hypothetical protein
MSVKGKYLKTTQAEILQRVADVIRWQVRGAGLQEIIDQSRKPIVDPRTEDETPGWGNQVSDRTIKRYIQTAKDYWDKYVLEMGHHALGKSLARLDDLYSRSLLIMDYKACLAIQREINEITGIKKIQISITDDLGAMTDEELQKEIKLMKQKRQDLNKATKKSMEKAEQASKTVH